MSANDRDDHGSPKRPASPSPAGNDTDALQPASGEGLVSNFVRRTDSDFHGVKDKSLIGEDVGWAEDELDEDGEPIRP